MTVLVGLELLHPALSHWVVLGVVRLIQGVCLNVLISVSLHECGIMMDFLSMMTSSSCLMRYFTVMMFSLV